MPIATATIMAMTAVAGLGMSAYSMYDSNQAQGQSTDNQNAQYQLQHQTSKRVANVNKVIENLKQKQANLDYQRNRREIIRNTIKAGAEATARASNAGALTSSSYQGARANVLRESGIQQLALYENKNIGDAISKQNKRLYDIQARAGVLGTNLNMQQSNIQEKMFNAQAIGSLGNTLFGASQAIGRIGDTMANGQGSTGTDGNSYAQFDSPWERGY